jgi:hypothetical protein
MTWTLQSGFTVSASLIRSRTGIESTNTATNGSNCPALSRIRGRRSGYCSKRFIKAVRTVVGDDVDSVQQWVPITLER